MSKKSTTLLWSVIWGVLFFIISLLIDKENIEFSLFIGIIIFITTYFWNRRKDKKSSNN